MSFIIENFELLSERPEHVRELKKLILNLALEGKLVNQNLEDEPANVLLEKIKVKKAELEKSGKINKSKKLDSVNQKDTIFQIPKNWTWAKLGQVGYTQTGTTPPKSNPDFFGNYIPFLGPGDIKKGKVNYKNKGLSELGLEKGRLIEKESILMVCIGGSIGKSILVDRDISCNQQINSITPYLVNSQMLFYILKSPIFQEQLISKSSGSATPIINKSKWENLILPLPPLAEQLRIVEKVNSLFQKIDALADQTQRAQITRQKLRTAFLHRLDQANSATQLSQAWQSLTPQFELIFDSVDAIKALRKSILQLAVKGKLVAQNRVDESASVLLEKIKKEKERLVEEGKIRKQKTLAKIEKRELPYEVPNGWVWCRLNDVGLLDRGKSKHRPRNDVKLFKNGKYPLVQTGDVSSAKKTGGIIKTHRSLYNDFGLSQSRLWKKGTLCITIAANIAECGILGFEACFPDSIVGFTSFSSKNTIDYVQYFITNSKSRLETFAPATAQKNINLGILNNLYFPLPPLAEQKRIVEKVGQLMAWCDDLESLLEKRAAKKERLLGRVLKGVFEEEEVKV